MSILLYECTIWTLTKCIEKKARRQWHKKATSYKKKSWKQYLTKQQRYSHLLPISITIQVWRTRHDVHCLGGRDELINNVIFWAPSRRRARVDTGYSLEDLLEEMNDRDERQGRVREIHLRGTTWWWRWWWR